MSFRAGGATVIFVAVHVLYGGAVAEREPEPELKGIARWMADWAQQTKRWHHDLVVLGDFDVDRRDDALWQAFTSTGLTVPEAPHAVPRSIFVDPARPALDKFYDQIAWFTDRKRQLIDLRLGAAGSVDFVPHLYRDVGLTRAQVQYRVSDHYPLWVEFV